MATKVLHHTSITGKSLIIHYITDDAAAVEACRLLLQEKVIGFDTETTPAHGFSIDPQGGLDPYKSRVRLVQFARYDGTVFVIDLFALTSAGKDAIRAVLEAEYPVKVGHNLKFDIKMTRFHLGVVYFGKVFCTELMARLLTGGLEWKRISLVRAAERHLGVVVDKEEQRSNWGQPNLSLSQLRYSADDAYIVLPLREEIIKNIIELDLTRAAKLELEALDPVSLMELDGFYLDKDRWLEAEVLAQARRLELAEKIWDALESVHSQRRLARGLPLFKIGSQKVMTELLTDFGITLPEGDKPKNTKNKSKKKTAFNDPSAMSLFGDLAPTGPSSPTIESTMRTVHGYEKSASLTTRNWKIKPLADRFEIISMLIEWRELNKRVTSYGEEYLKNINIVSGRIHADYDPLRAVTGRYGVSKPNLQQIPHITLYRRCFMPADTFLLVGADYSQIELRELAEFSGDQGFIEAFLSGLDFHDATTLQMFSEQLKGAFPNGADKPPKKKTPEYDAWEKTEGFDRWTKYRTYAKNINFGIPYGMGAMTLSIRTGMTFEEAQKHLDLYKQRFPKVIQYLNAAANQVFKYGQIRTLSGRIAKFRFDRNDEAAVAHAKNNGKNTPIQGGNADILKRAIRLFHDALYREGFMRPFGADIRMVNIVHDEIVSEAKIGLENKAAELLEATMKAAGEEALKIVPVKVDPSIKTEWGK